ncbi:MAG: hypothetical protein CMN21_09770 [Rubinisphaera sp.]|nr:hypothetical protein [Rubinisphaera sp.]
MIHCVSKILFVCFALLFPMMSTGFAAETISKEQADFFENKVRPILVEHCYECHGTKKQWADLRLDSHAAILKGGESGPAVEAGNPDGSRIIQVIRYSEDDSQMPPDGKMTDEQIASLTEWVSQGAHWPESSPQVSELDYFERAKTHWAFQPITPAELPSVSEKIRVANPIDRFIGHKVEETGLEQSQQAESRQQLRRLAFDLTGLPPSYEEVQQFEANSGDEAWSQAIDRYIGSKDFGQKWARHWLDLARYADTKGYVFTEERRYPFAYTYRDYVIDALNIDLPYDQFIIEQLAADLMPERRNEESLAALGFLTVGNRFLNKSQEIYDDRIDVTVRGLMGLTVACARCHDHKFDPLEQADYYSLYGVFASCEEPERLPQIGDPPDEAAFKKYKEELAKLEQNLHDYENKLAGEISSEAKSHIENYLLDVADKLKHQTGRYELEEKYEIRKRLGDQFLAYLRQRDVNDPVFGAWRRVINLKPEDFDKDAESRLDNVLQQIEQNKYEPNPLVKARLINNRPVHMYDYVKLYSELLNTAYKPEAELPETERENWKQIREHLIATGFPVDIDGTEAVALFHRDERNKHRELEKKIDAHMVTSPGSPPRAMVLNDKDKPITPYIFKRGNPGMRGDQIPRRFLKVLSSVDSEPFSNESSGRLKLAQDIASKKNPLTARVFVNRVWMQLIGQPLVQETSDFGLRTAPPSHPELLDDLSYRFMENNWSVKWLIKEIVSSETYRQTSQANAVGKQKDLENILVWRMNRKRLPFESMRDSILLTVGVLDKSLKGRSEQLEGDKPTFRRAIYGYIDRNNVSQLLQNFDVAGPSVSVSARTETVVPQQPLYLMNSPFVQDLCQRLSEDVQKELASDNSENAFTIALYHRVLQREPSGEELNWCVDYLKNHSEQKTGRKELAQALILTNEFLFVD